jgi:4-amino-4-deoxy-L-arabinose transferase-like glycosyltransferase
MDFKPGVKREALLLVIPFVLLGFGLRLWRALLQLVMFRDETTYAFQIKHVLHGTIFSDPTYFTFPPTYAFLAAPVALVTNDPELAGRLVSGTLGALTVVPVFYLTRDLFGTRAAAVAGFLTAIFPPFCIVGVMSEAT